MIAFRESPAVVFPAGAEGLVVLKDVAIERPGTYRFQIRSADGKISGEKVSRDHSARRSMPARLGRFPDRHESSHRAQSAMSAPANRQAQARLRLRISFSTVMTGRMIAPASALKRSDCAVSGNVEKSACIGGA